jgi:hypothetical protein
MNFRILVELQDVQRRRDKSNLHHWIIHEWLPSYDAAGQHPENKRTKISQTTGQSFR